MADRPGRLEGKVCVITGAASGIGAETARLFMSEGGTVVGVDLAQGSDGDLAIVADVTQPDQVEAMYARTKDEFGRIDVLFNNAGINPTGGHLDPEYVGRGLPEGPGRQSPQRLPLLQVRDPAPAGERDAAAR